MARRPGRPADQLHRRLARMLHTLTARPELGMERSELMEAMGLNPGADSDVRKFWRDLAALKAAGWQIDTDRRDHNTFRFRLRVVDARIRATFTDEERAELLRAAERAGLGQLYEDLDAQRRDGTPATGPYGLGDAQYAIRHRCRLRFTYSARERVVDPYDVYYSGDAWYLRGHELGAPQEHKTYRLGRASDILPEEPGTAGPIPDLPPPNRDPMLLALGEPFDAVLATTAEDLPDAISHLGVNGHRDLGMADDGSRLLEVRVTNADAFLSRVFEMDTRVRLVGPDHIRDRAREVLLAVKGAVA